MFGKCSGTGRVDWRREPAGTRFFPANRPKPTEGFEPSTPALRERCSGLLSYVGAAGDESSPAPSFIGVTPRRLCRLRAWSLPDGSRLFTARPWRVRLLGLALLPSLPRDCALLIPRCYSIHTFGMRFPIDVVFLDRSGGVLRVMRAVPRRRVVSCPGAVAVIELSAGRGGIISLMADEQRKRLLAALDPRQPIYRDTYNEYFVLVLSAGGAAAGTQVPLYIVMAITGLWSVVPFVVACVVFELAVIFGLARPQMKPIERLGWVTLWGATTAALAVCFYHLVAKPTL